MAKYTATVKTVRGASGVSYRFRGIQGSPAHLAITIGRGRGAVELDRIRRDSLWNHEYYVDCLDEETRILLHEVRRELITS